MTKEAWAELFEKVSNWSEEAQDELVMSIADIEARHKDDYELTEADHAAIARGAADADAGRFAPDGAVEALFKRYFG